MIEDGSDDLLLEVYPNNERSADILIPLIKKHVREGSYLLTTAFPNMDICIHKKVNHSDPENRFIAPNVTHTQVFEQLVSFSPPSILYSFYTWVLSRIRRSVSLVSGGKVRKEALRQVEALITVLGETFKDTVSVGDTETGGHRDGLPQLAEWTGGKYWFGVGQERKFNVATLTPTAEAGKAGYVYRQHLLLRRKL
ncbi:hypothetical protein ACJJTC_009423 [Scirpophaga incertulas]